MAPRSSRFPVVSPPRRVEKSELSSELDNIKLKEINFPDPRKFLPDEAGRVRFPGIDTLEKLNPDKLVDEIDKDVHSTVKKIAKDIREDIKDAVKIANEADDELQNGILDYAKHAIEFDEKLLDTVTEPIRDLAGKVEGQTEKIVGPIEKAVDKFTDEVKDTVKTTIQEAEKEISVVQGDAQDILKELEKNLPMTLETFAVVGGIGMVLLVAGVGFIVYKEVTK